MKRRTRSARIVSLILLGVALNSVAGMAFLVGNFWPDGDNIVMDNVLLPASPWGDNAEFQMSEWNEVDTTDNSHPFRVSTSPEFSFGANDGDNTIGFLDEAGLSGEYGLSFSGALAWTVCWTGFFSGRYDECDVIFDVNRPWVLGPDDDEWFQSTALHELGHVRGLDHYNNFLSIENSGTSKYLRGETLYMDDKVGVRQNASHVSERDIVMYNKWHDGTLPQWMSMSPLNLREGQTINLNNITVENRGTLSFGALRFGIYLSTNTTISTADTLLNTGSWGSFGTFTFSTFNWSATIPTVNDCGTRYIGGIIDDNAAYSERFEGNNAVLFTNGVPFSGSSAVPTPLNITLRDDILEPNDSRAAAPLISLPFSNSSLSIDADFENDYYRFTTPSAGQISISATFTHSLGNIDLQLQNSVGTVVASSAGTGNSESINFNVGAAGTYYVRVYGNGAGSCNKYSLNVTFGQRDLRVTALSAPADAVPGQTISVANTVRNAGTLSAGSFRVGFYLSADNVCTTGDTLLTTRVIPSLAGLTNHAVTTAMTIPPGTSLGPKFICAYADDQFAQTESSETNNTRFDAIDIVAKPDLVITTFVTPASSSPGATFKVRSVVQNNGLLAAGGFRVGFYLSDDKRCLVRDTFLASRNVAGLAVGATSNAKTPVTIPVAATLGSKTLCAIADDLLAVPESIESNNTFGAPILIQP
jgi:CARDB/Bacterial pre-peptidase C-terminal domain